MFPRSCRIPAASFLHFRQKGAGLLLIFRIFRCNPSQFMLYCISLCVPAHGILKEQLRILGSPA